MKLKCYIGNLDGYRQALVVTTSQKKGAQIAGCSLHHFRDYFSEADPKHIEGKTPDQLYTRSFRGWNDPWEYSSLKTNIGGMAAIGFFVSLALAILHQWLIER